eukprot:scaffold94_cov340-Prasinococcus_capsulatus_cf.AAC.5
MRARADALKPAALLTSFTRVAPPLCRARTSARGRSAGRDGFTSGLVSGLLHFRPVLRPGWPVSLEQARARPQACQRTRQHQKQRQHDCEGASQPSHAGAVWLADRDIGRFRTGTCPGDQRAVQQQHCGGGQGLRRTLEHEDTVVFLVSTYGDGEPTDSAVDFFAELDKYMETAADERLFTLAHLSFAVFGLGNRQYEHFNASGMLRRQNESGGDPDELFGMSRCDG